MPEEDDVGAAYLAALKRSAASPATGPATARSSASSAPAASEPAAASPFQPLVTGRTGPVPEKRRSPRYRCQGSAHLRDLHGGAATWATISDISMHGCYVETAAGYPLGSNLALAIEVNSFRVDVTGLVRINYPGLGMGISFDRFTDDNQARMRELLQSVSRPSVIMGARPTLHAPSPITLPDAQNPAAVLQAIQKFFEDRHVMGRDEFLRILRKSQP